MRTLTALLGAALVLSGCATGTQKPRDVSDLTSKDTLVLCRIAFTEADEAYRMAAAKLAVRRGASLEKCQAMIASDQSLMAGIAVAGVAVAAGAAAQDGYYPGAGYGAAWDQFPNGEWRCRDRSNGQFLPDYQCSGVPFYDAWP